MGEGIRRRLQQYRFEDIYHEAMLGLLVTAAHVRDSFDHACGAHGVTRGQYNVLRILRGAHPNGYPRCEIAKRLVERAPDVTRLIDRLERRGLLVRTREADDRRLSIATITPEGLELLDKMQTDVEKTRAAIVRRLTATEAEQLCLLFERLLEEDEDGQ